MSVNRQIAGILATAAWWCALGLSPLFVGAGAGQQNASGQTGAIQKWTVTAGKSLVVDSPLPIERLSVADANLADAVAIGPKEVIINGKVPGQTSLIVWQTNGSRLVYDLAVTVSPSKLEAVREQVAHECPGDDVEVAVANDAVFVRGTVKDVVAADRVMAIASTLGKPVNLLRVVTPPVEAQILVKVRFANVDRTASRNLSLDLASGALNQSSALGVDRPISLDGGSTLGVLADAVNIFLFRKDLNLTAAIQALESKNLLEMLAEPTVPAINGKPAAFVAGGEFPFPIVQPGANGNAISISWREYGVRLNFLPVITPRGTIRLQVEPEVSSLDYTHAVSVAGATIPALATRRVQTEIELESGQSFVIAGLIDNQTSETLSKIPGLGDIPLLGKLFQSKIASRNNSELLVIVTPEIVRPIPEGQPVPQLKLPSPFMPGNTTDIPLRHPGMDLTGPVPVTPPSQTIPVEQVTGQQKQGQPDAAPNAPQYQLVPVAPAPQTPPSVAEAGGKVK